MDKTETFAVGAIGAVIVFTLSCSDPFLFRIVGFLAPVIAALGAMRFWGLSAVIRTTDKFLMTCEPVFHPSGQGWVTYYEDNKPGWLGRSRRAFWIVLLAVCLVFPGVCLLHGKPFNLHETELPHMGEER